jgi:hypothetical protein
VILLAVGWYLRFSLSYRDVEELLAERGLWVDHVTVWRWVQRYTPELQRRLRRHLKPTSDSWRVDETYIDVAASRPACSFDRSLQHPRRCRKFFDELPSVLIRRSFEQLGSPAGFRGAVGSAKLGVITLRR